MPAIHGARSFPRLHRRRNCSAASTSLTFEKGARLIDKDHAAPSTGRLGPIGATARITNYGEVLVPDNNGDLRPGLQWISSKTLLDLEGALVHATDAVTLSVPAQITSPTNILTRLPGTLNTTNNTPFSNYSPYGYSGRFVYVKAAMNF